MLFSIDVAAKTAAEVGHVTLSQLQLRERYDLQELVLNTPRSLGEDLLIITSEFSGFDKTADRLDVLALDKSGVLTVVELKRSAVGTNAELQALRYAAFCSTMSLGDLSDLLSAYESRRTQSSFSVGDAEKRIREFVDEPDFVTVTDRPRIIVGAEEFSPEITATVIWLRTFGINISCVRLRPYRVGEQLLLESSVIIPLPEAREFQIRREIQEAEQARSQPREVIDAVDFLAAVSEDVRPVLTHIRAWLNLQQDVAEEAFKTLIAYRRSSDRDWVTWLTPTRREARVAIRPEVDVDPDLYVRMTSGGWKIIRASNTDEAIRVEELLLKSMQYRGKMRRVSQDPDGL